MKIAHRVLHVLLKLPEKAAFVVSGRLVQQQRKTMNIHSPHGLWLSTGLAFHQHSANLNAVSIVGLELGDLIRWSCGKSCRCSAIVAAASKREKDPSSGRHVPLVIYINGVVPLVSCQGQVGKARNKQCLKSYPFYSGRVFCARAERR